MERSTLQELPTPVVAEQHDSPSSNKSPLQHPNRLHHKWAIALFILSLPFLSYCLWNLKPRFMHTMHRVQLRDEYDANQVVLGIGAHGHKHSLGNHKHHRIHPSYRPATRKLSKDEQLATLVSYILSPLHSNSLPLTREIRMQDFLEFDIRSSRADEMIDEMVKTIWESEQVIIFGKFYHPPTRALSALLESWDMPSPVIVHLDKRQDGPILEETLLSLVTNSSAVAPLDSAVAIPVLLVRGHPIPGIEAVKDSYQTGELHRFLHDIPDHENSSSQ